MMDDERRGPAWAWDLQARIEAHGRPIAAMLLAFATAYAITTGAQSAASWLGTQWLFRPELHANLLAAAGLGTYAIGVTIGYLLASS